MKTYGNDRAKTFGISSSLIDAVRQVTSGQPIEEEAPEDESKPEQLDEDMSIHVSPHSNGTHYTVKKVGKKMKKHGGIKVGERLSDTEIDDAGESGVKVHHEAIQCDLPGRKKKLKGTPVEKAKKMHSSATPGQVNEDNEGHKQEFHGAREGGDYTKSKHASKGHELHQGGDRGGLVFSGKHPSGHSYTTTDHDTSKEAIHKAVKSGNPHLSKDDHKTVANDIHKHVRNMQEAAPLGHPKKIYLDPKLLKKKLTDDKKVSEESEPTHAVTYTKGKVVGARSHRTVYVTADHDDHAVEVSKKHRDNPGKGWRVSHVRKESVNEDADNPLIAAASAFMNESGMGRVAYQKQSGEPGTGLETFKKKPETGVDAWKLKGLVKRKTVSRDKRLGKEEVEFDEANLPRQMKDPKKDAMVSHPKHGTKVIDKKDEDKHLKKGWVRAEAFDPNLIDEGFQSAIDGAMRTLDSVTFKRRYGHSKADMRKRLSGVSAIGGNKVRREDVSHPEFGKGLFIEESDDRVTAMFGDGIKEVDLDEIDDWYIDGESVTVPLSEKKKKKLDRVDTKGLEGEWGDRDDRDIDNDGDEDESDKYLHKRRKKIKKSMKEWTQDTIVGKMIENPSRSAADAYQLATHFYNMSKGIDEELLDKAATFYETFLEMDQGENPVFRFEHMDKVLEARKGGGAAVGETERSGHRVTKTEKDGPEHIAMQLRKVQSLKGQHGGVDFNNGSKEKIDHKHASAALNRYNAAKPADKEEMQRHMAHSHDALKHVASGKPLHSSPATQKKSSSVGIKSSGRLEPTRNLVHPTQDKRPA